MISREPLAPPRPVPRGFGWIDHRFLRDGHIRLRTHRELSLYLLLVLAADSRGVSFYGDRLARRILGHTSDNTGPSLLAESPWYFIQPEK